MNSSCPKVVQMALQIKDLGCPCFCCGMVPNLSRPQRTWWFLPKHFWAAISVCCKPDLEEKWAIVKCFHFKHPSKND